MSRSVTFSLLVLLLLVGCRKGERPPAASTPPTATAAEDARATSANEPTAPADEARDQARLVLERSCGACHIGDTGGLDGALAVFNLSAPDWAANLTPEQAADVVRRLKEPTTPSMQHPDGEPNSATADDVKAVAAYLDERIGLPAERSCFEECMMRNQMRAVAAEQIERECRSECGDAE